MSYGAILAISMICNLRPVTSLNKALEGSWVGTLEYRDYTNNSRVKLGTLLRVYQDGQTGRLNFHYVYDDGPKKVVQDDELIDIDLQPTTYSIYSVDGKLLSKYLIIGLPRLSNLGYGKLILNGSGAENGVGVDIRETLTIDKMRFRILRESRLKSQGFLFRDEYVFWRVSERKQ